jgi:hypothetical protein
MCYRKWVPEQNDKKLINFIATTVETMRDQMATKQDLVQMATTIGGLRDQMATKQDLVQMATTIGGLRDQMATKQDLARVETNLTRIETNLARVENQMATKDELAVLKGQMATKNDLGRLETTMRGEFEQVHIRLDSVDRMLSDRMGLVETEISRIRSVLYLLIRDKPDMLRLLGQPRPGESRPQG